VNKPVTRISDSDGETMAKKKNEIAHKENREDKLKRLAREKKAADLRYQLARLEDGEDLDLVVDEEPKSDSGGMISAEGMIGGLGHLGTVLTGLGVEDTTSKDAEGGPGIKFQRPVGSVESVTLDGRGRVIETKVKPDEWPPRGEKF